MPTSKRFLAGLPLVGTLLLASCDQGGGASNAPPPPLPLSWNDVPDEITVAVGEEETFTATLTAALPATYSVSVNGAAASVSGEQLRPGVYRVTVVGVEAGEAQIALKADYPGYATASGTVDIVVEELFDEHLWRELVFDAYDCPSGDTSELCLGRWGNRQVEDRITVVLPSQPNFHIFIGDGDWRFNSAQEQTVRDAIRAAVEQVTGERFAGEITSGRAFANRHGWVDIAPVRDEHWEDQGFFAPCGSALAGATKGFILINLDALMRGFCNLYSVMLHEVGHSLGSFHVLDLGDYIMSPYLTQIPAAFSKGEQFHARLAWELGRGARYTPDPRNTSSTSMAVDARPDGTRTLRSVPLEDMIQCRPR